MADGLQDGFSLGRGFSEELSDLANYDFEAEYEQDQHPAASQDTEMFAGDVSGSAAPWDSNADGSCDGDAGGRDWLPRFGSASAPAAIGVGSASAPSAAAPPAVPGAVVITTFQGGRGPFEGLNAELTAGHQLFGSFKSGHHSAGGLSSGGGPSSSGSPHKEADAEEQRRLRRRTLNRESAKRARSRQRSQLEEAQAQALALAADNERLQKQVEKAEAARDKVEGQLAQAQGQLAQAQAQLAAAQHDGRPGQRGGSAGPSANARIGTSGSGVGSSVGSGASEASGALPLTGPQQQPSTKSSGVVGSGGGGTDTKLMPPPPRPQLSTPRLLPTTTQRAPRRKTRQHTVTPSPHTLRTTSAPAAAASSPWQASHSRERTHQVGSTVCRPQQSGSSGPLPVRSAASAPAQQGYDTSQQPPPKLQMGQHPYYVVSTGIPTPAAPAPLPPRFQVPPPKPSASGRDAMQTDSGGAGSRSLRSNSGDSGGSMPSASPFSDVSDKPFQDQ